MAKVTASSIARSRAHAADQRRLGLKVGGTMTEFQVSDGLLRMRIEAWGNTPSERATAAKNAFRQNADYISEPDSEGRRSQAVIKERR